MGLQRQIGDGGRLVGHKAQVGIEHLAVDRVDAAVLVEVGCRESDAVSSRVCQQPGIHTIDPLVAVDVTDRTQAESVRTCAGGRHLQQLEARLVDAEHRERRTAARTGSHGGQSADGWDGRWCAAVQRVDLHQDQCSATGSRSHFAVAHRETVTNDFASAQGSIDRSIEVGQRRAQIGDDGLRLRQPADMVDADAASGSGGQHQPMHVVVGIALRRAGLQLTHADQIALVVEAVLQHPPVGRRSGLDAALCVECEAQCIAIGRDDAAVADFKPGAVGMDDRADAAGSVDFVSGAIRTPQRVLPTNTGDPGRVVRRRGEVVVVAIPCPLELATRRFQCPVHPRVGNPSGFKPGDACARSALWCKREADPFAGR